MVSGIMEINGIAHIFLTVSNFERSRCFYSELLPFIGLQAVIDNPGVYYCVGARTAIGIQESGDKATDDRFQQSRVGLHHFCLRARNRDDIDTFFKKAVEIGATIVRKPTEGQWAPGYYSTLIEDPDGIRLEINYVPGKGLLE